MTSAMSAVAVPSLLTTTPAAAFAMCIACVNDRPPACASASAAITVSPAPETSKTSRARAGTEWTPPFRSTSIMPFSERVTEYRPGVGVIQQPEGGTRDFPLVLH